MSRLLLPRRKVLQLMGAAGVGALAAPRAAFGQALTPATLQLSWLHSAQFGGSYIALDRGIWEAEGLDVTLLPGGPNAPVEPPVVAGTALMGISAADYAGPAIMEGAPFKIIAVAMQKNPFTICSLPANPVNTPADLVGKRIGMATTNTPILQAICTFNNVDFNAITIVPTQYDAAPLANGEVDCLLCWLTDLPIALTLRGIPNVTMLLADYGYSVHSQTYIVTDDSLANRRDEVIRLLRGEIAGWNAYREDTDAAAELTVAMFPDLGLDLEVQKLTASEQVKLMFSPLTDEFGFGWWTDETVAENVATLAAIGITVTPDIWDRSILEEIYA
ncbi:MAG: ABC transporter substrate-binding protein [Bauldia sp.]|nr:ABC transporter substrate-binding protein [Bauldia sp.]